MSDYAHAATAPGPIVSFGERREYIGDNRRDATLLAAFGAAGTGVVVTVWWV